MHGRPGPELVRQVSVGEREDGRPGVVSTPVLGRPGSVRWVWCCIENESGVVTPPLLTSLPAPRETARCELVTCLAGGTSKVVVIGWANDTVTAGRSVVGDSGLKR